MNYMIEMFRGIKINVTQTKPMTYNCKYICNCSCHGCILISKIVLECLPPIALKKVSKSQIKEGIVSSNNSVASKNIVCLWWLVPRKGAKDISNLFVWGVKRHNITKAFVIHDRLIISSKEISDPISLLIYLNGIKN
jgi:hypothetical protein